MAGATVQLCMPNKPNVWSNSCMLSPNFPSKFLRHAAPAPGAHRLYSSLIIITVFMFKFVYHQPADIIPGTSNKRDMTSIDVSLFKCEAHP